MKACTAKGWAVWLFLVVLAVGRAGADNDKNIVASHLGPVCDLSAALKFVAAKAKEARSCIPDDTAGGEGTDTVLFAKAFGAAWRWGADNTNDTVRAILLETRVFAQRAERAQRIAAMSEHLAAMATEKADRIDEFVRMLANYKASSGNGYCLGDGTGAAVGTNNADPDDDGTKVGTGSGGKAENLKGCSGTGTTAMDYAKGKWESKGHAKHWRKL
ncbi:putative Trypanosome variant surface glycoprotein (A type) [Trypanosoma vivax]|nr:putative Trypanosome variant surface glycoprotein (A type) [Trypanosoma vivax]